MYSLRQVLKYRSKFSSSPRSKYQEPGEVAHHVSSHPSTLKKSKKNSGNWTTLQVTYTLLKTPAENGANTIIEKKQNLPWQSSPSGMKLAVVLNQLIVKKQCKLTKFHYTSHSRTQPTATRTSAACSHAFCGSGTTPLWALVTTAAHMQWGTNKSLSQ